MGALEFAPALGPKQRTASPVAIDALVRLASEGKRPAAPSIA